MSATDSILWFADSNVLVMHQFFCEFMMKMDASGDVHMHMAHYGLSSDMSVTKDLSSVAYEDAECDSIHRNSVTYHARVERNLY